MLPVIRNLKLKPYFASAKIKYNSHLLRRILYFYYQFKPHPIDQINMTYYFMKNQVFYTLCAFVFSLSLPTFGQEHEESQATHQEHATDHNTEPHKKHAISGSINHTIIFSAVKNGESKTYINVPSFGLNYTYAFNKKWGLGLHNDIILEDFLVQGESSEDHSTRSSSNETVVIERGRPISMAIMGIYKPIRSLGIMAGAGIEFSSHEDYAVIRFGLEAPVHLPNHWEVFGVVTYDIMIDAYTSLTYGIGIVKLF